ncbi:hypothetical protein [Dongia mobilis]|jgi:hypothetical protein|uniref:hypothetical protein n=1 Tax=Dongia sp. TaxID=1977262 RepID=UPI0026F1F3E1
MPAYDFILSFKLPSNSDDPAAFTDALFKAGCDDATVGVGKLGTIALDFTRTAANAEAAARSAISAVEAAIPGAEFVNVKWIS